MTFEIGLILVVLVAAMAMLASGRFPPDVVALGVVIVVFAAGLIDTEQAIGGFANPAVVTIGAVYVMSSGLARTGVAFSIGQRIGRLAGNSERRLVAITMLVAGGLSGFMNAIGGAAVLLPAVVAAARELNIPISRVLIPLSYATLMGSLLTLVGTPANLLVHSLVIDEGYEGFGLFEFTPFGVAALVVGITVMTLGGRRLLPVRAAGATTASMLPTRKRPTRPVPARGAPVRAVRGRWKPPCRNNAERKRARGIVRDLGRCDKPPRTHDRLSDFIHRNPCGRHARAQRQGRGHAATGGNALRNHSR